MKDRTIGLFAAALLFGAVLVPTGAIVSPVASLAASTIKNQAVGKPLKEAQDLAKARRWREALAKAREADAVSGKSAAEAAAVNQFIAYVAVQAGDYQLALSTYDRMIAAGQVDRTQGLRTAMQLALHVRNASKAMSYANQLGGVGGADRLALASIHYQSGNYREVIRMLRPGAESAGADTLEMLRSAYYKVGDTAGAQFALELLVRASPTPEHWRDLLRTVEQRGTQSDHQLLDIYRLRMAHGAMKDASDYVVMGELALAFNLPNEAKTVLTKGYQAKLLSGDRNQRLMEKATASVAQDQATLAQRDAHARAQPTGDDDIKLGEAYWSWNQLAEAQAAIERGIKKDKLKDPDEAKLRLGQVLLSAGKRGEALRAFNSIPKASKQYSIARLWALHAERG